MTKQTSTGGDETTRILILVLMSLWFIGCGTGGRTTSIGGLRNILTAEEIAKAKVTDAYEAVSQLRPFFLHTRSISPARIARMHLDSVGAFRRPLAHEPEASSVVVYVDNVRYGDISTLKDIPAGHIQRIEYMDAADATTRFGTGHTAGVIMVVTKKKL